MHQPIKDGLETYLRGGDRDSLRAFEAHLNACPQCRAAVHDIQQQSELLRVLRPAQELEPSPGFYARVMNRIDAERKTPPSFWTLLVDPLFGKRLMYATLALLILMGTYLVSTEPGDELAISDASTPEAILASDEAQPPILGEDQQRDRDAILVTLTTYQE